MTDVTIVSGPYAGRSGQLVAWTFNRYDGQGAPDGALVFTGGSAYDSTVVVVPAAIE